MLRLDRVIFELVAQREQAVIAAAESVGFREVLVIMEMLLKDYQLLSWY